MKRSLIVALLLLTFSGITACGSGSSSVTEVPPSSSSSGTAESPELLSQCGTVINMSEVVNPVPAGTAERVTVTANRPDAVVITHLDGDQAGNPQVVKLHGAALAEMSGFRFDNGVNLINQLAAAGAYYVPAGAEGECPTTIDGTVQGVVGQIYTLTGQNITEELIQVGSLVPSAEGCAGDQLAACYASLEVNVPVSSQRVSRFIWKPVAERDGNLVVLVDAFNATIEVRGAITQTLVDFGPSNGYGTTARASKPGCSFGSAQVYFFDAQGRQILVADGSEFVSIPNGCDRVEF